MPSYDFTADSQSEHYKELSEAPTGVGARQLTLQQLYEEYIAYKQYEVRETTLARTSCILCNHVLPYFHSVYADKLNIQVLVEWKSTINQKALGLTMKRNIFGELRALLNYAVRMDYIDKNPLIKLGNFKEVYFSKPQDTLHYYTPEQFKKFISEVRAHAERRGDFRYYVFFNIAFFMGMRKGEINALRWEDIEGNIAHIRRSVALKTASKQPLEQPPKNKSSYRDIQIPLVLLRILDEHKSRQKAESGFCEQNKVCGGKNYLRDTRISGINELCAKRASLPHIRIHDFRHSHASLLANEGINIQEIARRLGHSKIEVTWNIYSHLYPREEERAVRVLEAMFP